MNISCSAEPCPIILDGTCVFYTGANLIYTGIVTNDCISAALYKIDQKFKDAAIGYIFQNGIIQAVPGGPVKLGGTLTQNTVITSGGYTFALTGTIESTAFITTGGTSSQFVKGDGSLDSTAYQPADNYITELTGDGTAIGPGSVPFTLSTTGVIANVYGSSTQIPVITVDTKGRITWATSVPFTVPPALLIFSGDVTGVGYTNSTIPLTLNSVLSTPGTYGGTTNIPIVTVNDKGLITGISQVPFTSSGGTVTSVGVSAGTGISASVANPTTTPVITITNTLPDQIVTINPGTGINVIGSYPNFTISATSTGSVTAVTASSPLASSGGTTPNITIQQANASQNGYLSSADWTNFNNKQGPITLTTTGSSGPATFIANTLNIPDYSGVFTTPNLQQVTDVVPNGNITTNQIIINNNDNYGFIHKSNSILGIQSYVSDSDNESFFKILSPSDNTVYSLYTQSSIQYSQYGNRTSIVYITPTNLLNIINVPDASGTFALSVNGVGALADGSITIPVGTGTVTGVTATSPITSSGGTAPVISTSMATNKLIGRSTAGTGVMEEITIGTGLSLSAGTLTATATGGGISHATATGTDTYAATVTGVTSYTDGDAYIIQFTNGNTTSATLNINSIGAVPLYRNNDSALIGGDIQANGEMLCVYDATVPAFRCIGTSPNSIIAYVTNADSVTITKGQPVYAFGGQGDRMTVKLAYNTTDSTSAQTVGLVMSASIAANQKGFIMMQGLLDGLSILPTSTFADGDAVYLGTTAGSITPTKQYAPNHLVYLGFVTTASNGAAGRMYVRVQNGYELDEIHNVQAQSPSLNDTLYYDSAVSPGQWKTASIPTILGYTPIRRSVNVVSTATAAGSATATDYVYLVSGTTTVTLPTAVGNTNRYTIKNTGSNTVSIATTSSQTIDGSASPITINVQYVSLDLISDGSNWNII